MTTALNSVRCSFGFLADGRSDIVCVSERCGAESDLWLVWPLRLLRLLVQDGGHCQCKIPFDKWDKACTANHYSGGLPQTQIRITRERREPGQSQGQGHLYTDDRGDRQSRWDDRYASWMGNICPFPCYLGLSMSPTIQDKLVPSSSPLMNSVQCEKWKMSYLSLCSKKVPATLTVLYLQLISDKVFGKTNDINSDEVKTVIKQIQYGFFSYTGKKFNF